MKQDLRNFVSKLPMLLNFHLKKELAKEAAKLHADF